MRVGELAGLGDGQLARAMEIECQCFAHPWTMADFDFVLANERAINLGLWRGEELVGYAMAFDEGDDLHLVSLAVESGYRRRGWAGHLLRETLVRGAGRGCRICRLEVRPSNLAALALYGKFGFEVVGEKPRYYTSPSEDALILERRIESVSEPDCQPGTGAADGRSPRASRHI